MLTWVLAAGAVICLLYYLVIILYSGMGTSFAIIWLLMGAFLGLSAAGVRCYQRYPERLALWVPVSLVTLCASGMVIVMIVQMLILGTVPETAEQNLDYVIVLGASVKKDGISKTLKLRLDKAAEYAFQNPDTVLVLSGGQGDDEPESEAAAMQMYLLQCGVPEKQILLEDRSHNTTENIAYSKLLIETQKLKPQAREFLPPMPNEESPRPRAQGKSAVAGESEQRTAKVGLLTSNFHLFRTMKIAEKQGMEDLQGIAAEADRVLFVHFCFRDCFAILKDRLVGNL